MRSLMTTQYMELAESLVGENALDRFTHGELVKIATYLLKFTDFTKIAEAMEQEVAECIDAMDEEQKGNLIKHLDWEGRHNA